MWHYGTQNKIHRRHGKMEDGEEEKEKRREVKGQNILSDRRNKI